MTNTSPSSYARHRANKLGLPPPSLNPFARNSSSSTYRGPAPAPGGIRGWLNDRIAALRNKRTAGGNYESTTGGYGGGGSGGAAPRRGFGPLDPDEAWDARVDHETSGYYEEQELGDAGPYNGGGYGGSSAADRHREIDRRYDEEMHYGGGRAAAAAPRENPFGDHAEARSLRDEDPSGSSQLRSVSPRPAADTAYKSTTAGGGAAKGHTKNNASLATNGSADESPSERRSMFREDV